MWPPCFQLSPESVWHATTTQLTSNWEQYTQRVFRGQQPVLLKLLSLWCHVTFHPPPILRCWAAGQRLKWCLSQHPNMWQCVHHHPLICEARGTSVTSKTELPMACCAKRSGSNDRDTARRTLKQKHLDLKPYSSFIFHLHRTRTSEFTVGLQMLDKFVLNLFWSCDSTSEALW